MIESTKHESEEASDLTRNGQKTDDELSAKKVDVQIESLKLTESGGSKLHIADDGKIA